MTQAYRLESGGEIRRERPLRFRFDGRKMFGYEGDTLASALLANGVRVVARSFKYHRPRGIFSAGIEEPNALVQLHTANGSIPNVRATVLSLRDELTVTSLNAWPSARWDLFAVLGAFRSLLPAGFYYKAFRWPSWSWFEPAIRRLAGLGTAPTAPDANLYDERDVHVDVLVIGAGAAGLSAAVSAARHGARTLLLEAESHLGGGLRWCGEWHSGSRSKQLHELIDAARSTAGLKTLTRTIATGAYDHNLIVAVQSLEEDDGCAERLWRIRARHVIVATGAIERPAVFADNDRPGVMLASAVRRYVLQYAVAPGKRVLVFTNNASGYETALTLDAAGVPVAAVVDPTPGGDSELASKLTAANIPLLTGGAITKVIGRRQVRAVEVSSLGFGSARRRFDCDLLAVSAGWTPTVHLYSHSGGELSYDDKLNCFVPKDLSGKHVSVVGAAAGQFDPDEALGEAAELGAAAAAGKVPTVSRTTRVRATEATGDIRLAGRSSRRLRFVDLQSDVTEADVCLAAREGYRSVEHLKRYTTVGMAPDQGKTSNMNALAILAQVTERSIPEVGTTRFRPPYVPVTFGVLAGRRRGALLKPRRFMPGHTWHESRGAMFDEYGDWQRPACYPMRGESMQQAAERESLAVRTCAGLFESSPLGKIEVFGPDAADFLDRMYVQTVSTLQSGRIRYGVMLNEHGIIVDDGVCARLAPDRFLVSTTSAGANRIAASLEEWSQCEWPLLRVVIINVTEQWGSVTLSGPQARAILQRLRTDIDLSPDAFPHMSVREGAVGGVRARILRVSFTGECSYEINVPASLTSDLLEALEDAGRNENLVPYGVEATMILRTEKGYLHVGSDTDGTTLPQDVGLAGGLGRKPVDFVGRRSLSLPAATDPDRLQFVGFRSCEPDVVLPVGAQVPASPGGESQGYITSSCFSPTLRRGVSLGMLRSGRARLGERVTVVAGGRRYLAEIVPPASFDPEGVRLRA